MHLYVAAKGIKPHLEKWQNDLLAQWIPKWKDGKPLMTPNGKQRQYVQLAVRPVQLFEVGFPKEELDNVMNIIGTSNYVLKRYPMLNMGAKMLRKTMKLNEVPKPKKPMPFMQPHPMFKSVAVIPIGLKDDLKGDDGTEQL